jgi:hypothetical protein
VLPICLLCCRQAPQRLVQLAYAVLQRFSQGSSSDAADQPPQQQQQQQQWASGALLGAGPGSGSWGSKLPAGVVVPLAPPMVVYSAFAPLVVSTLKVGVGVGTVVIAVGSNMHHSLL